jgi:HK97 family phage prohead protease
VQSNRFNVPFVYDNEIVMLDEGCFGDIDDFDVKFLIDHDPNMEIADTSRGLELFQDKNGIQFRLDLQKAKNAHVVARLCQTDSRSSVSVGCDIIQQHDETIAGHNVRIITKARLREISICREGCAGEEAFAMLVDTTSTPKPVAGSRSTAFQTGHALHKLSRRVRALKASIVAMYE